MRFPRLRLGLCLLPMLLPGFAQAVPAPPNPIQVGQARFTVVSPLCVRLEYAANGQFVDETSLFAVGRTVRYSGFRLTQSGGSTVIDTGVIRLTYTPDGQPFSPSNLQAVINHDGVTAQWTPGTPNPGNLGGTILTLDGRGRGEELSLTKDGAEGDGDDIQEGVLLGAVDARGLQGGKM